MKSQERNKCAEILLLIFFHFQSQASDVQQQALSAPSGKIQQITRVKQCSLGSNCLPAAAVNTNILIVKTRGLMAGIVFTHPAGISFELTFSISTVFKRPEKKQENKTIWRRTKAETIRSAVGLLEKHVRLGGFLPCRLPLHRNQ